MAQQQGQPPVLAAPVAGTVEANGEWSAYETVGNQSGAAPNREFFSSRHRNRIRQNGTITEVEFYISSLANLTGVYIRLWRYTGSGTLYNRIGQSENLLSKLVATQVNRVTLSSPITGALEGDYLTIRFETTLLGVRLARSTDVGNAVLYQVNNTDAGPTNFNWHAQASLADTYIKIRAFMNERPQIVYLGDSHLAGRSGHHNFNESTTQANDLANTSLTTHIGYKVAQLLPVGWNRFQVMALGGTDSANALSNFASDGVALSPQVIVLHTGWNDVRNGTQTEAQFLTNLETILDAARDAGIVLYYLEPSPIDGEGDANHAEMETRLLSARKLISKHDAWAFTIMQRYRTGTERSSGPANNLWDWQAGFAGADTFHPSIAGQAAMAEAIVSGMDAWSRRDAELALKEVSIGNHKIRLKKP